MATIGVRFDTKSANLESKMVASFGFNITLNKTTSWSASFSPAPFMVFSGGPIEQYKEMEIVFYSI